VELWKTKNVVLFEFLKLKTNIHTFILRRLNSENIEPVVPNGFFNGS
tara:strand:- start:93 stop:233 length:141 start_codon:yes stop_codon:yes gene_type:complete